MKIRNGKVAIVLREDFIVWLTKEQVDKNVKIGVAKGLGFLNYMKMKYRIIKRTNAFYK